MQKDIRALLTVDSDHALSEMESSLQGLDLAEAKKRYRLYGSNQILQKHRPPILDAIGHSTNPLIAILIIAALISAFTGNMINAGIIILVVSLSVFLDYFQTHRSLLAAKKLQEQVATTVNVLRNNKQ